MIDCDRLRRLAEERGVPLTPETAGQLDVYAELLVEWSAKMNLTAIKEPEGILVKHFLDSLTLVPLLPAGARSLIDVGTGAGFPGVVLKLVRPELSLTLLDSTNKRLTFLAAVCETLGMEAARVHARAEEGGRTPALRERFDVATARAVAALPTLCEYCLPFVRPGGVFLAMKGPDGEREAIASRKAAAILGGRVERIFPVTLPPCGEEGESERRIVEIKKRSPLSARFPRASALIAKQPL